MSFTRNGIRFSKASKRRSDGRAESDSGRVVVNWLGPDSTCVGPTSERNSSQMNVNTLQVRREAGFRSSLKTSVSEHLREHFRQAGGQAMVFDSVLPGIVPHPINGVAHPTLS